MNKPLLRSPDVFQDARGASSPSRKMMTSTRWYMWMRGISRTVITLGHRFDTFDLEVLWFIIFWIRIQIRDRNRLHPWNRLQMAMSWHKLTDFCPKYINSGQNIAYWEPIPKNVSDSRKGWKSYSGSMWTRSLYHDTSSSIFLSPHLSTFSL